MAAKLLTITSGANLSIKKTTQIGWSLYFLVAVCSLRCDWWEVIIGLDKGMAPNSGEIIILTNDDQVQGCIYAALGRDSFIQLGVTGVPAMN